MVKQCQSEGCANEFEAQEIELFGRLIAAKHYCDPCCAAQEQKQVADEAAAAQAKLDAGWQKLCPPLYRDTDPALLKIDPATIALVLSWQRNPKGIGLAGETGIGKTRLMFLLLKKLHHERVSLCAITSKQFERWCHQMFEKETDARKRIEECRGCPVLFIDDIGKEKYTERVESEVYDLIEHRASHQMPVLWTSNASGARLKQMMGEDRGAAIVRRLREFSTVL